MNRNRFIEYLERNSMFDDFIVSIECTINGKSHTFNDVLMCEISTNINWSWLYGCDVDMNNVQVTGFVKIQDVFKEVGDDNDPQT